MASLQRSSAHLQHGKGTGIHIGDRISNRFLLRMTHKDGTHGMGGLNGRLQSRFQKRSHLRKTLNDVRFVNENLDSFEKLPCCPCTHSQMLRARILVLDPTESPHESDCCNMIVPDCSALSKSTTEIIGGHHHQGGDYDVAVNDCVKSHKLDEDTDLACMVEEPTYLKWRLLTR